MTKGDILKKAIEEKLGETNVQTWYEPIHGPCFEMCGYEGGWYYSSDDTNKEPLGYNIKEALEMVELSAELRKW